MPGLTEPYPPVNTAGDRAYVGPRISCQELDNLIGRLLTLNDAATTDPDHRRAVKTLIKATCREWLDDQAGDQRIEGWLTRDIRTLTFSA